MKIDEDRIWSSTGALEQEEAPERVLLQWKFAKGNKFTFSLEQSTTVREYDAKKKDWSRRAIEKWSTSVQFEFQVEDANRAEVKGKLPLEYDFLGKQTVKNIAEEIPAVRVLSTPGAAAHRVPGPLDREVARHGGLYPVEGQERGQGLDVGRRRLRRQRLQRREPGMAQ